MSARPQAESDPWSKSLGSLFHFSQVLASISELCVTPVARESITSLWPIVDLTALHERYTATAELLGLLERESPPPLSSFPDIRPALQRAGMGVDALGPDEFHRVRQVLQLLTPLERFLKEQAAMPYWRKVADDLNPWPPGVAEINRVVEDDVSGPPDEQITPAIKSSASKTLQQIRTAITRREEQARSRLAALHRDALKAGWAQNEPIAWRDGRLVIALKASHKRKLQGLIHGYSSSGATAFVEPLEIFDINNEVAALREDEQAEIHRLLTALTAALKPHCGDLACALERLYQLDAHLAQARWAARHQAVQPQLAQGNSIEVTGARNPILAEHREVVPLDLSLGEGERILLISGPNAGGKTVVLLTLGLFIMLAQSGLFVPAKRAELPLCQGLFADLGDRQSLENDLSTFSAHLLNLKSIVAACGRDTLVLLDELGTGTEPEAGAALGQTFLEAIMSKGAFCLATTHLNRLKLWAQGETGVLNAGMTFDPEKLRPTYQLQIGQPGASYALEIARRMGLDDSLLKRAQTLMPDAAVNLDDLLVELETDRARLVRQETELSERIAAVVRQEQQVAARTAEVQDTHRRARRDALQEAERLVTDMNRRLEATIAEIRRKGVRLTGTDIRQAKQTVAGERQRVADEQARLADEEPQSLAIEDVVPGMWVVIREQGRRGQVEQVSRGKQRVTVLVDGTRLSLPLDQLAPAQAPSPAENPPGAGATTWPGTAPAGEASYRLDLRGWRGEAAVAEVDRFLNRAILADLSHLEIIHGKGAGILQKLVREFLANQPQVKSFDFANFDAGGTGVTLVELR